MTTQTCNSNSGNSGQDFSSGAAARNIPELLAPAGSLESLHAAVENGADTVYFGLSGDSSDDPSGQRSFNARVRAENIPLDRLAETTEFLRNRGVKAYVALNTLVRSDELSAIESLLRMIAEAEVDAVLVQDFGVARLSRRFCPELTLHASTQMSLTSARGIEQARSLGIRRVVLPRELSIKQIRMIRAATDIELECFAHGALCMSFSGQCFASLALGGRSANRGRCAQPCRMPYTLIDGETGRPLDNVKQLLSPCDLASLPLLADLVATGIESLKIEGRLKPPEYVAEVTRTYRNALDRLAERARTEPVRQSDSSIKTDEKSVDAELNRLALTFSRGFSTGWLEGVDPRRLVPGTVMSHRGTPLGTVVEMRRDAVVVRLSAPVRRGDGVLFENEEHPERSQGGRVYEIFRRRESVKEAETGAKVLLTFANDSIDPEFVREGQSVRKTDDPKFQREVRRGLRESQRTSLRTARRDRIPLDLRVEAHAGKPIQISVRISGRDDDREVCRIVGDDPLEKARKHPLDAETLREQFDRLGKTAYRLDRLTASIDGEPMIPLSVLGTLRRRMIQRLDSLELERERIAAEVNRPIRFADSLDDLRREDRNFYEKSIDRGGSKSASPELHLLLRDVGLFEDSGLIERIVREGCRSFYVELQTVGQYKFAADSIRRHDARFVAVLPRIVKPGESKILNQIAKLKPDAFLVRNLEELSFCRHGSNDIPVVADFSLNAVNDLSFRQLFDWGADRITPGWDLDENETFLGQIPAEKIERIVVGRIPLFTMEHCLWKGNLVEPERLCERICRIRPLKIRDRRGALHSVRSDLLCRNIVDNSTEYVLSGDLSRWRHLRIEWDARLGDATPLETLQKISRKIVAEGHHDIGRQC